jgi:hypothetical protein
MTRARPAAVPPEAEYAAFERAFACAWTSRPDVCATAWLVFAAQPARLRVAGKRLSDVYLRAFSHLRIDEPARGPALTIEVWDEEETGVGMDGLEADPDLNAPGETFVSGDGRVVVTARAQTRTVFDRQRRHIIGWVGSSARLTQYEMGRPLHAELLLWHKDRDVQAVHAGLVARRGDGLLLGGPGGSGKSTVALCCLDAGYRYIGDDYVGVRGLADGGFVGHSLYCSTHLEPTHLTRFPWLEPHAIPGALPREDKSLVMLSEVRPDRLGRSARIRAVVLPRVVDVDRSSFRPASKIASMLRLAPTSLLQLPYAGVAVHEFEKLTRFVETVPTYWFDLGRDFEDIPKRIGDILDMHA